LVCPHATKAEVVGKTAVDQALGVGEHRQLHRTVVLAQGVEP
jgi:hypothetical protein